MKKMKGLLALLLASAMTVTTPAAAFAKDPDDTSGDSGAAEATTESPWVSTWQEGDAYSDSEKEYQIYPVPQSIEYPKGNNFELGKSVKVVAGGDIDKPTLDYLDEVLGDYERTSTSAESVDGTGNIVIGIYNSNDEADQWFKEKALDESLFEKSDAYALYAEDGNIYILGKDTDAAFYGVATLKMMFSSFAGEYFVPVQIEDYASIDARGFVEGFYGGWKHDQRKSLMEFTRDMKMNIYVYAAKSDQYHTQKWADLYPEETINEFKELIDLQEKTKCEFSWSVHLTQMLKGINSTDDAQYKERKEKLKKKFDQLYDIGVRRFCILNDDFGSGSNEVVVQLINDLNEEYIKKKPGCKSIIYCPQGYNDSWERAAEMEAMKGFDDDVMIFWTGRDVNSPMYKDSMNNVINKTNHNPVYWVNYPCQEHAKSAILIGNASKYYAAIQSDADVQGVAGAVSNPIFFAETSKVALFQLASYFWNVNDYNSHVDKLWEQSFKYLEPEVYDEYLTIARNVSDCKDSTRIPGKLEESEYIKDKLASVEAKIEAGTDISSDQEALDLLAEFRHIQSAVDSFMKECQNEALVQELSNPGNKTDGEGWLQALKNVALAGEMLLSAEMEMDKASPDLGVIWENFASASAEMSEYNARTYQYPDGNSKPKVRAGSKRIVPFVETCMEDVNTYMEDLLADANEETADRVYTNMEEYASAPLTIQEKEYSLRNIGRIRFDAGDYIGIKKSDIADISALSLEGSGLDSLTLQYSLYGDEWTDVNSEELSDNAMARYVRLINEGEEPVTAVLSKLGAVIDNLSPELTVVDSNMSLAEGSDWSMIFDGNTASGVVTTKNQSADDYIIVDLGFAQEVHDVTVTTADGTPIDGATLSFSEDNVSYDPAVEIGGGAVNPPVRNYTADADGVQARYMKLTITAPADTALTLYEIAVNKNAGASEGYVDPSLLTTNTSGNTTYINDKDLSTVFLSDEAEEGDYLEYKVVNSVNVEKFRILQNGSCGASVVVVKADGSEQTLGTLSNTDETFDLEDVGAIHAIRLKFAEGKSAQISEIIVTYGADPAGDIGQAVDNIYLDSNVQDSTETVNLALNQPVEVSGVETASVKPESAVDGNMSTKWDSGALKGANASSPQWIIVDLGGYSNLISNVEMSYYNKVYPTDYDIQVSDDKENWVTVKTIQHENNGSTYPTDTVEEEFAVPVMARYVRLLFRSINSGAAGNCIGLRELEVNGVRRHAEMSYVSVQELEDQEIPVGEEVSLPSFVEAAIKAGNDEQETAVKVIPEWDPADIDTSAAKTVDVLGSLPYRYNLSNPLGCEIQFTVTVGEGSGEEPGIEDTNLITGSTVEVSDVEWELNGSAQTSYTGDLAIDGNSDTRWSSGPLNAKSYGTPADQWLVLDLGEHTAYIDQIRIDYYLKVWPTNYHIQVSNDKETWIEIAKYDRASSNDTNITDTIDLDVPVMARYIRLYYPVDGLNQNAAGGSVSIKELAVTGKRAVEGTVYSAVEETLEQIEVENTAAAEDLGLQQLIDVKLDHAGESITVQAIPTWDLSGWDELENVETTIYGSLPVGEYVQNPDNVRAEQTVVKGTPETEEPDPEPEIDKTALAAKIQEAQALTESDYTADSWAVLQSALAEAVKVNEADDVDQQAVDQALAALENALAALEGASDDPGDVKPGQPEPDKKPDADKAADDAADKAVETGDSFSGGMYVVLILFAGIAAAGAVGLKRKVRK